MTPLPLIAKKLQGLPPSKWVTSDGNNFHIFHDFQKISQTFCTFMPLTEKLLGFSLHLTRKHGTY